MLRDLEKLSAVQAGQPTIVTLQGMDSYSNALTEGGAVVTVDLGADSKVQSRVTDKKNGRYMIELESIVSGLHSMTVLVNGTPCDGSPYQLNIVSYRAHAPSCIASGRGLERKVAEGFATHFIVYARDHYGNMTQVPESSPGH